MLRRGNHMLLAVVLGLMLGIAGKALLQQWLSGALTEARETRSLSPAQFPRLAPSARPARTRPAAPQTVSFSAPRAALHLRRAA